MDTSSVACGAARRTRLLAGAPSPATAVAGAGTAAFCAAFPPSATTDRAAAGWVDFSLPTPGDAFGFAALGLLEDRRLASLALCVACALSIERRAAVPLPLPPLPPPLAPAPTPPPLPCRRAACSGRRPAAAPPAGVAAATARVAPVSCCTAAGCACSDDGATAANAAAADAPPRCRLSASPLAPARLPAAAAVAAAVVVGDDDDCTQVGHTWTMAVPRSSRMLHRLCKSSPQTSQTWKLPTQMGSEQTQQVVAMTMAGTAPIRC